MVSGRCAPVLREFGLAELVIGLSKAKQFSGAAWAATAKALAAEQAQIQQELLSARPLGQQMRVLLRQLDSRDLGPQEAKAGLQGKRLQLEALRSKIAKGEKGV